MFTKSLSRNVFHRHRNDKDKNLMSVTTTTMAATVTMTTPRAAMPFALGLWSSAHSSRLRADDSDVLLTFRKALIWSRRSSNVTFGRQLHVQDGAAADNRNIWQLLI